MADFSALTDAHTIKSMIPAVVELFKGMQSQFTSLLDDMKKEFLDFAKTYDEKVAGLNTEISSLKKKVSALEEKIDENEAYERRDCLILSGKTIPPASTSENTLEVARKVLSDHLQYILSQTDVSTAHRLGKKPVSQREDNRSIILKFCRRDVKMDLLSAARRVKPQELFLNESLTPQRQNIAYALRKAKRELPHVISGVSTKDGRVFAWIKPPNPNAPGARDSKIPLNTYEKFENFCDRTLQKPVSYFFTRRDL